MNVSPVEEFDHLGNLNYNALWLILGESAVLVNSLWISGQLDHKIIFATAFASEGGIEQ